MQHINSDITNHFFKLIGTYEFYVPNGDDAFTMRIELFRSLNDNKVFCYKAWEHEFYRIQSTFPQNDYGKPRDKPSDEMILIDMSLKYHRTNENFNAGSPEDALNIVVKDINKALEYLGVPPIDHNW